jgi:hypothetical protein
MLLKILQFNLSFLKLFQVMKLCIDRFLETEVSRRYLDCLSFPWLEFVLDLVVFDVLLVCLYLSSKSTDVLCPANGLDRYHLFGAESLLKNLSDEFVGLLYGQFFVDSTYGHTVMYDKLIEVAYLRSKFTLGHKSDTEALIDLIPTDDRI